MLGRAQGEKCLDRCFGNFKPQGLLIWRGNEVHTARSIPRTVQYVLGAGQVWGERGPRFHFPGWKLPAAWWALAIELDDKSLGRLPSLSVPYSRAGEAGVPRQGRLVSGWV